MKHAEYFPTMDECLDASWNGRGGFCLACGEEQHGVEPDAARLECECCSEHEVYGAEQCLLEGYYKP